MAQAMQHSQRQDYNADSVPQNPLGGRELWHEIEGRRLSLDKSLNSHILL